MQSLLTVNISSRHPRYMRRRLIHHNYQVASAMMPQHLPQEINHLTRGDALFEQPEQQATLTAQRRHGRHTAALAGHANVRRLATKRPRFPQERRQRHVRFVLEVQNSPEFACRSTNPRHFGLHPLFASFLIEFEVASLRFLVREARVSQSSPDGVFRKRDSIMFLNYSAQPTHRPQVRLKTKVRRRFQDDIVQRLHIECRQQTRASAAWAALQSTCSLREEPAKPTKKRGSINAVSLGHLPNWLTTPHRSNGARARFQCRVPSLAHAKVRTNSAVRRQCHMLQFFRGGP